MKTSTIRLWGSITAIAAFAGCASDHRCSTPCLPPQAREEFAVPLQSDEGVLDLTFCSGDLVIGPSSCSNLLVGECEFYGEWMRPQVDLTEDANVTRVDLGPDDPTAAGQFSARSTWNVGVNQSVPWALDLDVRTCSGQLDLGGVPLTHLDVDLASSDLRVSFDRPNPVVLEELRIAASLTDLSIRQLGNARIDRLKIDGGDGLIELNFQGDWTRSAYVEIDAGLSDVVLALPHELPVRITGPTSLKLEGFTRHGQAWVNDAWLDAEESVHLAVQVDPGLGDITVRNL